MNSNTAASGQSPSASMIAIARRQERQDQIFHRLTQAFSLLVLLALVGIIGSLFINAWPSFAKFGAHFLWYVDFVLSSHS